MRRFTALGGGPKFPNNKQTNNKGEKRDRKGRKVLGEKERLEKERESERLEKLTHQDRWLTTQFRVYWYHPPK